MKGSSGLAYGQSVPASRFLCAMQDSMNGFHFPDNPPLLFSVPFNAGSTVSGTVSTQQSMFVMPMAIVSCCSQCYPDFKALPGLQ